MVSIMDSASAATDPSISSTSRGALFEDGIPVLSNGQAGHPTILTGDPPGPGSDGCRIDRHPEPPARGAGHRRQQVTEGAVIGRLH